MGIIIGIVFSILMALPFAIMIANAEHDEDDDAQFP